MERVYQKEFKQFLESVFATRSYFGDFFGGEIEALDGIRHNAIAFDVKTTDIPVKINNYDTEKKIGEVDSTDNVLKSRFGERTEVIYTDTPVPYTWNWGFEDNLDRATVNMNLEEAVADRLDVQAQTKINMFNQKHAKFVSEAASEVYDIADFSDDAVVELFNKASAHLSNKQVFGERIAKVVPELYNAIADHPLATVGKKSTVNIDDNSVVKFKGFVVEEIPEVIIPDGEVAYFYAAGVAKAFTGIDTLRTIESELFNGVALQGSGKAGEYIPEGNKQAVLKVTLTPAG